MLIYLVCDIVKVMEDDQEIGAYMFRRTVPSMHLTPEDVRCMVCVKRILFVMVA